MRWNRTNWDKRQCELSHIMTVAYRVLLLASPERPRLPSWRLGLDCPEPVTKFLFWLEYTKTSLKSMLSSSVGGRCLPTFMTVSQLLSWLVLWPPTGNMQLDGRCCKSTQQRWADMGEERPLIEGRVCLTWSCSTSALYERIPQEKAFLHPLPLELMNRSTI